MIPAGAAVSEMLIDEPPATMKLKKPVGSTWSGKNREHGCFISL